MLGLALLLACAGAAQDGRPSGRLRVGAAAVEIEADDAMVIGGSIHAGKARGQDIGNQELVSMPLAMDWFPGRSTFQARRKSLRPIR